MIFAVCVGVGVRRGLDVMCFDERKGGRRLAVALWYCLHTQPKVLSK